MRYIHTAFEIISVLILKESLFCKFNNILKKYLQGIGDVFYLLFQQACREYLVFPFISIDYSD